MHLGGGNPLGGMKLLAELLFDPIEQFKGSTW